MKKNKLFAWMLAMLMLVAAFPLCVSADEYYDGDYSDYYEYYYGESTEKDPETEEFSGSVAGVVVAFLVLGGMLLWIIWSHVQARDHGKWNKDAQPSFDAKIVDFSFKTKSYGKNDVRFLSTVTFSDGYVFISTKSNRKDRVFTYQISMDEELRQSIIGNAIDSHFDAVKKKQQAK